MDMKHYLEHLKKDETGYKEENIKPEAIKKLKAELILEKLKTIIKVDLTDEEIQTEINKILKNYQNPEVIEKLKVMFAPETDHYEDVKNRLNYKKIIDTFFE
jgi:trigger factor